MRKLDNSDQIIKGYEDYISDKKIQNDILDKVCGDDVKDICSEKNVVYKNTFMDRFIKNLNNSKRELQSSN